MKFTTIGDHRGSHSNSVWLIEQPDGNGLSGATTPTSSSPQFYGKFGSKSLGESLDNIKEAMEPRMIRAYLHQTIGWPC